MTATADLRAALLVRYPGLSALPTAQIDAHIDDARLQVPTIRLGDLGDTALIYKAVYLLLTSPPAVMASEGGNVKRIKSDNAEIEYMTGMGAGAAAQIDALYKGLLRKKGRPKAYPTVLTGS